MFVLAVLTGVHEDEDDEEDDDEKDDENDDENDNCSNYIVTTTTTTILVAKTRLDPLSRDRVAIPLSRYVFRVSQTIAANLPSGPIALKGLCKGGGVACYLGVFGVSHCRGIARDWTATCKIVGEQDNNSYDDFFVHVLHHHYFNQMIRIRTSWKHSKPPCMSDPLFKQALQRSFHACFRL